MKSLLIFRKFGEHIEEKSPRNAYHLKTIPLSPLGNAFFPLGCVSVCGRAHPCTDMYCKFGFYCPYNFTI